MSDENIPEPVCGVEIIGPFEHFDVVLDGFRVPKASAIKKAGEADGAYQLLLDRRWLVECRDKDELYRVTQAWAYGQAIGAGYSSFGQHSGPSNPYKTRMVGLGDIPPSNPDSA